MSDLISRQDAIKAINYLCEHYSKFGLEYHPHVDFVIDAICDVPSAEQWIPCSERLPEDLEEVNVTFVNHDPEPYYNFAKDKPFTATAVYYKEKWYWYSSVCADLLAEYGENKFDEIDGAIEVTAWMPLPEPYKESEDKK